MTKDVLLSIRGLQFNAAAEETNVETVTPAEYYKRNNKHFVVFEESSEGFEETTRNIIKFQEHSLDLTKRGLVNVHMIFDENKKNMANYVTPFGNILVGIDARRVRMKEEDQRISVDVDYALEINYEYMADCKLTVNIMSKGEEFSLQKKCC